MAFLTLSALNPCPFKHISSFVHPVPTRTCSAIPVPPISMAPGSQTPQPSWHGATNPTAQYLPNLVLTHSLLPYRSCPGLSLCTGVPRGKLQAGNHCPLVTVLSQPRAHTARDSAEANESIPPSHCTHPQIWLPLHQLRRLHFIAITAGTAGHMLSLCTPQTLS